MNTFKIKSEKAKQGAEPTRHIAIRFPPDVERQVRQHAHDANISIASLVRQCVRFAFDNEETF